MNSRGEKHDDDAMVVEGPSASVATPESIAAGIEHQKLEESRVDATNSSLQNHVDSSQRLSKRPNDPDEMSVNHKRRRTPPPPESDELSPIRRHMTDSDHEDSPEALDATNFSETFLDDDTSHPSPGLLRDLETRAISVSQLIQEVKGIYAGLGKRTCV